MEFKLLRLLKLLGFFFCRNILLLLHSNADDSEQCKMMHVVSQNNLDLQEVRL